MITPLNAISRLTPDTPAAPAAETKDLTGGFGAVFKSAIDQVIETDAAKNQAEYLLSTGQLDNPVELSIASTKAELSVSMLVQLRNKALDAYTELTRISL